MYTRTIHVGIFEVHTHTHTRGASFRFVILLNALSHANANPYRRQGPLPPTIPPPPLHKIHTQHLNLKHTRAHTQTWLAFKMAAIYVCILNNVSSKYSIMYDWLRSSAVILQTCSGGSQQTHARRRKIKMHLISHSGPAREESILCVWMRLSF